MTSRAERKTRLTTSENGDAQPPIILELNKGIYQVLVRFGIHTITGFREGINDGLGVIVLLFTYGHVYPLA